MIEKIREVYKLQNELYKKHNVAIVSYPDDPIRVLVYDFNKIIEIADDVTFEKTDNGRFEYCAIATVEEIEFEAYATKRITKNTKKVVLLTRPNKKRI